MVKQHPDRMMNVLSDKISVHSGQGRLKGGIAVLDFGGQYSKLIARRVRESGVYSEVVPFDISASALWELEPGGIILSGGPSGIHEEDAPRPDTGLYDIGVPVLGICYGMQLLVERFQGRIATGNNGEYGPVGVAFKGESSIFEGLPKEIEVWMSHGDSVSEIPAGFIVVAESESGVPAAISGIFGKHIFIGLQFHPEVSHTQFGKRILENFLFEVCNLSKNYDAGSFIEKSKRDIRSKVGDGLVLCALSGGVDSTVVSVLVSEAIGSERVFPVLVDNGLLRKDEAEEVVQYLSDGPGIRVKVVDASDRFFSRLSGITDPERKRKIIGETFIDVFREEAERFRKDGKGMGFLAQGTLYPDVIESVSVGGPSSRIKSHHNVGGLPDEIGFELVEPLRELFKDEVRKVGRELGIPESILSRQPFPGPGLAVRIIGEVTEEKAKMLREADAILRNSFRERGFHEKLWQFFAVLVPVKTVGVMGDERTYGNLIAVRAVESSDGMTARIADPGRELLEEVAGKITSGVKGINRVVYDISSKPPSTIEWE